MNSDQAAVDQFVRILAVMAGITAGTYLCFGYFL